MTINLKEGERLDELQRNGYRIIQNPEKFCFGMDAVLLSGFAKVKAGERALDSWEREQALSRFCSEERQKEEISQVWRFRRKAPIWQGAA